MEVNRYKINIKGELEKSENGNILLFDEMSALDKLAIRDYIDKENEIVRLKKQINELSK